MKFEHNVEDLPSTKGLKKITFKTNTKYNFDSDEDDKEKSRTSLHGP
jgi:hypothetical protein